MRLYQLLFQFVELPSLNRDQYYDKYATRLDLFEIDCLINCVVIQSRILMNDLEEHDHHQHQ